MASASLKRYITIPTWFTIARIALIPFIVFALLGHAWDYAFWLFALAALTDLVDGALARVLNERSFLGACLDPIADKLLVVSVFAALAYESAPSTVIPAWFVWLILAKELTLIVGACIIYFRAGSVQIKPCWLGKLSMLAQSLFVAFLFIGYFISWLPYEAIAHCILVLALLAIAALISYIRQGIIQWLAGYRCSF